MLIALAIAAALAALLALYLSPHLERKLAERRLAEHCRATGSVVLSFDDGPGPRLTPKLLDLLRELSAPATFFALGRQVAGRLQVVSPLAVEAQLGVLAHVLPNGIDGAYVFFRLTGAGNHLGVETLPG